MPDIFIGTSGYSFPDWKGRFYPADIKPSLMLDYYIRFFNAIEINATYYRIPPAETFDGMNRRTPDGYPFIVKTHQQTTHEPALTARGTEDSMRTLFHSIAPIRASQKLKGFLAQFPFAFRNTQASREHLVRLKEYCREIPLFVEFRHAGWNHPAIVPFLKHNEIGYVNVDEPKLPGLLPPQDIATTPTGYIRFHGRNAKTWWRKTGGDGGNTDRYDYGYSESELMEWVSRIDTLITQVKGIYLFFNNCVRGQAAESGENMQKILGIESRGKEETLF